jgi:hypothetical protein
MSQNILSAERVLKTAKSAVLAVNGKVRRAALCCDVLSAISTASL